MATITSRQHELKAAEATAIAEEDAVLGSTFSRTLVTGVVYGLVGWFHVVLTPTYAAAGLLHATAMDDYPVGPWVWAITYVLTGVLMLVAALGLVNARAWAWKAAPWCVLPNLLAHALFFAVLPLWGLVAVASDLLVLVLVIRERRHYRETRAAVRAAVRQPRFDPVPYMTPLAARRRPT